MGCMAAAGRADSSGCTLLKKTHTPEAVRLRPAFGAAHGAAFGSHQFRGKPTTWCGPAQTKQACRHAKSVASHVVSGQPTVLAKPAISVMPVVELREDVPLQAHQGRESRLVETTAHPGSENGPSQEHCRGAVRHAKCARPAANTTFVVMRTGRPPSGDEQEHGGQNQGIVSVLRIAAAMNMTAAEFFHTTEV